MLIQPYRVCQHRQLGVGDGYSNRDIPSSGQPPSSHIDGEPHIAVRISVVPQTAQSGVPEDMVHRDVHVADVRELHNSFEVTAPPDFSEMLANSPL